MAPGKRLVVQANNVMTEINWLSMDNRLILIAWENTSELALVHPVGVALRTVLYRAFWCSLDNREARWNSENPAAAPEIANFYNDDQR